MRYKQLEEEREVEKNKWLMFSSKVSIFNVWITFGTAGKVIKYSPKQKAEICSELEMNA